MSKIKIYLDRFPREKYVRTNLKLSKSTLKEIDKLFGKRLTKSERSRVIDILLAEAVHTAILEKDKDNLIIAYRSVPEEEIM